jgi:hypothetical protein
MMNINMHTNRSTLLQKEAFEIIDKPEFLGILRRFGNARIVGGVALGLVVKRGIDIHLVLENAGLFEAVDENSRILYYKKKAGEKPRRESF